MGDDTREVGAGRPASAAAPASKPAEGTTRPDYRLKTISEQVGGTPVKVAEGLELMVPDAEIHLATPQATVEAGKTCSCNSVCTCVPVAACACHAVCRCDTVAAVAARPPRAAVAPPRPAPPPPSSGSGHQSGGHYWRPN